MSAVGRKPVVTGLGLECAGIELTEKGAVKTNDLMQTNVGHIYAIGDLTGKLFFFGVSASKRVQPYKMVTPARIEATTALRPFAKYFRLLSEKICI